MENQVATLKQSARLKEVGFPQDTECYWFKDKRDWSLNDWDGFQHNKKYCIDNNIPYHSIAAPTLYEMMEYCMVNGIKINCFVRKNNIVINNVCDSIEDYIDSSEPNPTHTFAEVLIGILEE